MLHYVQMHSPDHGWHLPDTNKWRRAWKEVGLPEDAWQAFTEFTVAKAVCGHYKEMMGSATTRMLQPDSEGESEYMEVSYVFIGMGVSGEPSDAWDSWDDSEIPGALTWHGLITG